MGNIQYNYPEFYNQKNRCIDLEKSIRNHSHYGPCLNGSKYDYFRSKSKDLHKCINIFEQAINLKEEIIKENNNLKVKEKNKYQTEEISKKKYESKKEELMKDEENKKEENDKALKILEEKNENEKIKVNNEIEELEKEIKYIKDIINKLNEKNEWEIKVKKEEILNNLEHEYDLKVDKYEKEKELQKIKNEEKIKYLENEIKYKKEMEFAKLRKSCDLVNKIITRLNQFNFAINN